MSYKVRYKDEDGAWVDDDAELESRDEAEEYGQYLSSCANLGSEILHMSNPYDYSGESVDLEWEIVESYE